MSSCRSGSTSSAGVKQLPPEIPRPTRYKILTKRVLKGFKGLPTKMANKLKLQKRRLSFWVCPVKNPAERVDVVTRCNCYNCKSGPDEVLAMLRALPRDSDISSLDLDWDGDEPEELGWLRGHLGMHREWERDDAGESDEDESEEEDEGLFMVPLMGKKRGDCV